MNRQAARSDAKVNPACQICGRRLHADEVYRHRARTLCEDCCLDVRTPHRRKTHWQYIGSIRGDYLIPARGGQRGQKTSSSS